MSTTVHKKSYVLITGGAGFIGTNLAHRLLGQGKQVMILDNLSRTGVEMNLDWLRRNYGDLLQFRRGDVRDLAVVQDAVKGAEAVYHFAAQVAVTTSILNPLADFEVNARGTLNMLEAVRALEVPPPFIYTSTNKTYGALDELQFIRNGTRYLSLDTQINIFGVSEEQPLDCHSPYGCSKGAADQYVIDYARTFQIPALVFRMSCIYGPHQFGNEDQGWVAHFLVQAITGQPITVYGDGLQVRDILFIDDLVNAFMLAQKHIRHLSSRAYNIGGGPENTISLLELVEYIRALHGVCPSLGLADWRLGDQRYYCSDIRRFNKETGWRPKVPMHAGIEKLYKWLREHHPLCAVHEAAGRGTA